ncbi:MULTISPECIES: winged helix-turn-helix domain-containing protein [Pseudomonas]|jgi:two-component system response regulator ParR|uniref:winged helix-turn-helix domain-containing protein n=1 Tax=Pseudomonas TaxID=286 RepID=UPI00081266DB|nr:MULTISPECIES: winged helix-turn-helix domain-containing protein [unclassified Pseudomonas]POM10747.1 DNA-binding response regulator [Pseudomonas sp. WP001]CRM77102.1 Transcriptional regulatory protein RstA [Pseudomonas sp. 44 R 15]CRM84880.1 Transcriptional regulatory protein RstA [Pseudomonas sp. 24 E 13]
MENLGLGKVLLVEDDERLAGLIAHFLSQHGFEVRVVHRGDLALDAFLAFKPKMVVLDLMLPGQSGLHVCREIRSVSDTPIVILTAREDDLDHILGLESGADDYVIKPIKPPVLLARLRALQRRQAPEPVVRGALAFGRLSIDRSCRVVRLGDEQIDLTTMEFELLWLLASNAGTTLSRDDILNRMRGIAFDGLNRSVDVYISKLRGKLNDNPREPVCIKTIWGKGYLFNAFAWEV